MARKTKPPKREATQQVGLRIPGSILKQVDDHAERLRKETGLVTLSRTDAALALLVGGLEAAEKKRKTRT